MKVLMVHIYSSTILLLGCPGSADSILLSSDRSRISILLHPKDFIISSLQSVNSFASSNSSCLSNIAIPCSLTLCYISVRPPLFAEQMASFSCFSAFLFYPATPILNYRTPRFCMSPSTR
eukprot:NODE_185_length_15706_cov_0.275902.p10 type:complete len:120 gc:universal NODE_185_length_15706_cov_0.275902:14363-14004(-)